MRNWTICFALAVLMLMVAVFGCTNPKQDQAPPPVPPPDLTAATATASDVSVAVQKSAHVADTNVVQAQTTIHEVAGAIAVQAETLRKASKEAEPVAKVLDAQAETLNTAVESYLTTSHEQMAEIVRQALALQQNVVPVLQKATTQILAVARQRDEATASVGTLKAQVETEKKKTAVAEKKASDATGTLLAWLIALGAIGIAGGIGICLWGNLKAGIATAAGSLILVIVASFVSEYLGWLVWAGVIVIVAVLGLALYSLWQYRKAFGQTGTLVEAMKAQLDPATAARIFGTTVPGVVHTIVDDAQSALVKLGKATGLIQTPAPAAPPASKVVPSAPTVATPAPAVKL